MKNRGLMTIIFALLYFFGSVAEAQVAFSPTVFYASSKSKDDNDTPATENSSTVTSFDFRLGYIMPAGLYWGGIYAMESATGKSSNADTSSSAKRYGASLGFVSGGFNLIGHYFLSAELTNKVGSVDKSYSDGKGLQVDVGWNFMVGSTIGFGPQFSYRNIDYGTRTYNPGGVVTKRTHNTNEIEPRLAFWFLF